MKKKNKSYYLHASKTDSMWSSKEIQLDFAWFLLDVFILILKTWIVSISYFTSVLFSTDM